MTTKTLYSQYDEQPPSPKEVLPTMYDLVDEEEGQCGLPDIFHLWQARLLDETFRSRVNDWSPPPRQAKVL